MALVLAHMRLTGCGFLGHALLSQDGQRGLDRALSCRLRCMLDVSTRACLHVTCCCLPPLLVWTGRALPLGSVGACCCLPVSFPKKNLPLAS